MNRRFQILLFALLGFVPAAHAGDLLDRIVATVNGHIILQTDWDDSLRYEALTAGRQPGQIPVAERKSALDRLIDQELLQEQMRATDFQHATEAEVSQRIAEIRKLYSDAADDTEWKTILTRHSFDPQTLRQRVALELDLLRLVDARLRPGVSIDSRSIESYYNQELLPRLRQTGEKEVSLAEVRPRIQELLTQRKVNELLEAWLINLRSGSRIQTERGQSLQDESQ